MPPSASTSAFPSPKTAAEPSSKHPPSPPNHIPPPTHETTPLLPRHASPKSTSLTTQILTFMTLHFLIAFCEMVLVAPLIKLFEQSLCEEYYGFPVKGVEEDWCKVPEVQGPLAVVRGWKGAGDGLPVLLVAIPIGNLGDKYGRKKIMAMSIIGMAASLIEIFVVCAFPRIFPLRLVWLSSIFLLCGGGLYSTAAFMWAQASAVISGDKRSYAFYYIFSSFYIAELVASFLASVTIDISPWIPCGMAMISLALALLLLWFMPNATKAEMEEHITPLTSTQPQTSILTSLLTTLSHPQALLCIPVFLVGTLRYTTLNILIQYSSIRFHTSISHGSLFYTETAVINIFLFLFLVPRVTKYVKERYELVRPERIDLGLVRCSVVMLFVGSLMIGLVGERRWVPFGVAIFAAGFGSRVSTLSLISYYIPSSSKATLYAAIAVLENLGHLVNDPSLQHIFAATLRLPVFWWALPFFVAAICYALAGVSTLFIRVDGYAGEEEGANNEETRS